MHGALQYGKEESISRAIQDPQIGISGQTPSSEDPAVQDYLNKLSEYGDDYSKSNNEWIWVGIETIDYSSSRATLVGDWPHKLVYSNYPAGSWITVDLGTFHNNCYQTILITNPTGQLDMYSYIKGALQSESKYQLANTYNNMDYNDGQLINTTHADWWTFFFFNVRKKFHMDTTTSFIFGWK